MGGLDEHVVRHALRAGGINGKSDSREYIEVVGLRRQERLAIEMDRRKLDAARIDRFAAGPFVSLRGQTFVQLDWVGKRKDDRPGVVPRHRLDDLPRKQLAHRADADEGRGLEVLNGRGNLRALARQVARIERLAG